MGLPPGVSALNTSARPSGESANEGTLTVVLAAAENAALSGGRTGKPIASRETGGVEGRAARNPAVPRSTAAAIQAAHSRYEPAGVTTGVARPGSFNASSIWNRPSAMSRSRCAGSFLRHLTRSDRMRAGVPGAAPASQAPC